MRPKADNRKRVLVFFLCAMLSMAQAQAAGIGLDGITGLLNALIDWLNNGVIRAVGILVLIGILVAAKEHHMEWKPAIWWMVRIAGAFSAAFLVDLAAGK